MVTLRDIVTAPETGTDLALDQALCITVVVSQVGPPKYSTTLLPTLPPKRPRRAMKSEAAKPLAASAWVGRTRRVKQR